MEHIVRSTTIAAPPAQIFPRLSQPQNLVSLLPGHVEISHVEQLGQRGWRYHWNRLLLGVHFDGIADMTTIPPEQRLTVKTTGGLVFTSVWTLAADDDETTVTLATDYTLPQPLLHKHTPEEVRAAITHDSEQMLANLRTLVEAQPQSQTRQPH